MSQQMRRNSSYSARSRQQGAVLYIALILLIILTIIGVAAARLQTGEAVMARNDNNHQLALQGAEAALRDAEINLADGNWSIAQFAQNNAGLYVLQTEVQGGTANSIADTINWNAPAGAAMAYTGPALTNAPSSGIATLVIIEDLPPWRAPATRCARPRARLSPVRCIASPHTPSEAMPPRAPHCKASFIRH